MKQYLVPVATQLNPLPPPSPLKPNPIQVYTQCTTLFRETRRSEGVWKPLNAAGRVTLRLDV